MQTARPHLNGALLPGQARLRLRAATAASHEAVDAAYSAFDLTRRDGYLAFLQAQMSCIAPFEAALTAGGARTVLPDWPDRRRAGALFADLTDLGVNPAGDVWEAAPPFDSVAGMLGAIYVLEGSRFGGAVLARRLPRGAPMRFLMAPGPPGAWRTLVAALDENLGRDADLALAAEAAGAVFAAFETAACRPREVVLG